MPVHLNHLAAHRLLEERGLSVTEAGARLGIDRANLSRMLSGRRQFPADRIPDLAVLLAVNPYELLGPEDPKTAIIELARLHGVTADDLAAVAS